MDINASASNEKAHPAYLQVIRNLQKGINEGTNRLVEESVRLQRNIERLVQKQYSEGVVDQLTLKDTSWITLSEGWVARPILQDDLKDVFKAEAKAGTSLPNHMHKQVETIYVISGLLRITVVDKAEETLTVKPNGSVVIPQHVPHSCYAEEDSILIITFQPPITKML